jgi:hypothetical protein
VKIVAVVSVCGVVIIAAGLWAGTFGIVMGICAVVAGTALFLRNAGVLLLPAAAAKLFKAVAWLAVLGVLVSGGAARHQEAVAKKVPEAAPLWDTHHYPEVVPGRVAIEPGKNHLSLEPGIETDWMCAPQGWHVRVDYDRQSVADPEKVAMWARAGLEGPGARSYRHSDFLARCARVRNDTGELVGVVVYLAPNTQQ